MKYKNEFRGFTLLEVLIALAVFSIISVMCYKQVNSSTLSVDRLEKKYLALWIAENALEEVFIDHRWPNTGETVTQLQINNATWSVSLNVTGTDTDDFRQLEARVYMEDKVSENPILSLTRYISKN